jgi:E3 ubiquitin-protein ligase mind-bomb
VDHVNDDGNTALHLAAANNHLDVAQLLMRWGAKLDLRNSEGKTAADCATFYGHDRIADAIRAEV